MPVLSVIGKELEVPDAFIRKFLPIVREVASGHLAIMDEKEIEHYSVDVGGRGIPYGTIRIRSREDVYLLNRIAVDVFLEQYGEKESAGTAREKRPEQEPLRTTEPSKVETADSESARASHPVPAPQPATASKNITAHTLRAEDHLGTREFESLFDELFELIASKNEFVTEPELVAFQRWLHKHSQQIELVELALVEALKSKTIMPVLRTRLIQYVWLHATPGVIEAVKLAAKDSQVKKYLQDPRIRSIAQSLITGWKESHSGDQNPKWKRSEP